MRANYSLLTAPDTAPVSLSEAKLHLRIEHDEEDAYIGQLVDAARSYLEDGWGVALITQTHQATLDAWPAGGLKLRPHPVSAIVEVRRWDGSAMVAVTGFQLIQGRPAFVVLSDGATPPQPARTRAGIEVEFTSGYALTEEAVPAAIKQAVLLLVGHWYENREASVSSKTGVSADLTRGVEDLMASYRSPRLT